MGRTWPFLSRSASYPPRACLGISGERRRRVSGSARGASVPRPGLLGMQGRGRIAACARPERASEPQPRGRGQWRGSRAARSGSAAARASPRLQLLAPAVFEPRARSVRPGAVAPPAGPRRRRDRGSSTRSHLLRLLVRVRPLGAQRLANLAEGDARVLLLHHRAHVLQPRARAVTAARVRPRARSAAASRQRAARQNAKTPAQKPSLHTRLGEEHVRGERALGRILVLLLLRRLLLLLSLRHCGRRDGDGVGDL